jgi:hypothetical protein
VRGSLRLGPNLAVTASLSVVFWLQVARANGAPPSLRRYSVLGVVLVPVWLVLALLATANSDVASPRADGRALLRDHARIRRNRGLDGHGGAMAGRCRLRSACFLDGVLGVGGR